MLLEKQNNEFLTRSILLLLWFFWLLGVFVWLSFCFPESYMKKKKIGLNFLKHILQWVVSRLGHYFPEVHPEMMQNVRAQWDLVGAELLAFSFASLIH